MTEQDILYTAGEFARLCQTTVATLLHYESTGLLRPVQVRANGWRLYSGYQYATYHAISVLKISGCSLAEIKDYLRTTDLEACCDILAGRQEALVEELAKLERAKRSLEESIAELRKSLGAPLDCVRLVHAPDEYIVAGACASPPSVLDNSRANLKTVRACLLNYCQTCAELGVSERFIPCFFFPKEDVMQRKFDRPVWFQPLPEKIDRPEVQLKPGGDYLALRKEGNCPDDFAEFVGPVMEAIRNRNATVCGAAYVYPLKACQSEDSRDLRILYEAHVPIAPAEEA